ncbi:MAG: ribosomal protein L11 methyltransferase [Candidatus Magnetoglobus multicellularis str. Araruama]|uniref:Ribosomal protein L11 methyltransferase n=1 Tax=Candidatus Magnetoglobus multicellularis str. Araruama TaxID=890399 RepID=A0A1V1PFU9_9BACT|nr:MAG: ribosomal protein L11 methyltransferase [Candidatus Magnetoglobus multicellularis str. Araruama]
MDSFGYKKCPKKNYQKMTVQVTPEWEEIFIVHCFEQGATGIEHLFETASRITLAVYFTNMSIQMQDIFTFFQHKYMLSPEKLRLIHCKIHQCKDWLLEWQKHFHPIPINNELIVCPPWEIPKDSVFQHHLLINPGNGFGSGSHPSTILALKLLSTHIENAQAPLNSILDVGTGSGILLIASQFLGLKHLVGMDIDFPSVIDAQNNFQLNHMTGQVLSICGSPECVDFSFDIVISNMMLQELKSVRNALKKI